MVTSCKNCNCAGNFLTCGCSCHIDVIEGLGHAFNLFIEEKNPTPVQIAKRKFKAARAVQELIELNKTAPLLAKNDSKFIN